MPANLAPHLTFGRLRDYVAEMDRPGAPTDKKTTTLGTIALVVTLLGLLVAASWFAARSWTSIEGPPMPEVGYVAMTIGVVFSLLIGVALMTLLFYSSRHGYDERAAPRNREDHSGPH
ncbi:MAG: hypothetical protein WBD11_17755 [Xanthobacteraceae bacterium]